MSGSLGLRIRQLEAKVISQRIEYTREIAALESRIKELEAKRGPGRPRKKLREVSPEVPGDVARAE